MKTILPLCPVVIRPYPRNGKALGKDEAKELLDFVEIPSTPIEHLVVYIALDKSLPILDTITFHLFTEDFSGSAQTVVWLDCKTQWELENQNVRVFEIAFVDENIKSGPWGFDIRHIGMTSGDIPSAIQVDIEVTHAFIYEVKSKFLQRQFMWPGGKRNHELNQSFPFGDLQLVVMKIDDELGIATCGAYKKR